MSRPSPLTRDGGAMTAAQSAVTLAVCVLMVTELILAKKDYYEILGVHREANGRQIKKAFHKLAMKYHPDKNSSPDAEVRFREIAEAYETLSDDNSRQEYDQFDGSAAYFSRETQAGQRHGAHQPFSFNFDDIFKDFDIYSQNRHASHRRNFDEHSRPAKESHSRHKRHFQGGFHDMFDDLERMFVFGKQVKQTENGFHGTSKQHCRTVTERKGNMVTTYTECNVT